MRFLWQCFVISSNFYPCVRQLRGLSWPRRSSPALGTAQPVARARTSEVEVDLVGMNLQSMAPGRPLGRDRIWTPTTSVVGRRCRRYHRSLRRRRRRPHGVDQSGLPRRTQRQLGPCRPRRLGLGLRPHPLRLPGVEFTLPPPDPTRRHLQRKRKGAALLEPPGRRSAEADDVPDAPPGKQPVLRPARPFLLARISHGAGFGLPKGRRF